jgi:hypothetical protein
MPDIIMPNNLPAQHSTQASYSLLVSHHTHHVLRPNCKTRTWDFNWYQQSVVGWDASYREIQLQARPGIPTAGSTGYDAFILSECIAHNDARYDFRHRIQETILI